MTYNYLEIIEACEDMVQKTASEPANDLNTLLKRLVNQAQAAVADKIHSQFGERGPVTLATVAEQETYDLPTEYMWGGLHEVYVDDVKYTGVANDIYLSGDETNVYKIDARGEQIYLLPTPTESALDIDLWFQINPPDLITGTASAGATTSITLDSNASSLDDVYNGSLFEITSGTGAGQVAVGTDYNGTTKVLTATFTTAPDSTSVYAMIPPFHMAARRAVVEKTIELYRKRQKLWTDKERSEYDYEKQILEARKNLKMRQTPIKMKIEGASVRVYPTEEI